MAKIPTGLKQWGIRKKGTVRVTKFFPRLKDAKTQLDKLGSGYEIAKYSSSKRDRGNTLTYSYVTYRRKK